MSYTVLARKWRPKNFSELVGQEHVMQALANALDQQRLHHAYLFTGTRGVGKTTIARIFSKALNCEQGITSSPCGQCANCMAIDEGRFVDLIEVDAASKTKVEDTRELLENVQYAPVQGRYKVYLIDEVHMLSKSSFNALLKTLEEPPEHVKFLLATTDPHKLPITVLSRCLQFNLMRLTQTQIQQHLAFVLQQESIHFEEPALAMIAKSADGSARDSLSILDQAIAYGGGKVLAEQVKTMLGLVDQQFVMNILQALQNQSAEELKAMIEQLASMGADYEMLTSQLIEALYQLTQIQILGELTDVAVLDTEFMQSFAQNMSADSIQLMYQTALLATQDMKLAPDIRIGFEMALLRMLAFTTTDDVLQNPSISAQIQNQDAPPKSTRPGGFSESQPAQNIEPVTSNTMEPAVPQQAVQNTTQTTTPQTAQQTTESMPTATPALDNAAGEDVHLAMLKERLGETLGKPSAVSTTAPESVEQSVVQAIEPPNNQHITASVTPVISQSEQMVQMNEWLPEIDISQNTPVASQSMPTVAPELESQPVEAPVVEQVEGPSTESEAEHRPSQAIPYQSQPIETWLDLMNQLGVDGMAGELANQSILLQQDPQTIVLSVDPEQATAKTELALQRLEEIIKSQLGVRLIYEAFSGEHFTPSKYWQQQQQMQQSDAREAIYQDAKVQALVNELEMTILDNTIKPKVQ